VAKVRKRLAVTRKELQRFHVERFSLNKLIEVKVKEQYHVEGSKLWKI
jgi:hypothetical protein